MKPTQKKKPGRPKGSKNKPKAGEPKAAEDRKAFYILWNPEGVTPPTAMFEHRENAEVVAHRMQESIGKGSMFIMKAVGVVVGTLTLKKEAIA